METTGPPPRPTLAADGGTDVRKVAVAGLLVVVTALPASGMAGSVAAAPVCDGAWHVAATADHSQQSGEIDQLAGAATLPSGEQWAVGSWAKYPEAYTFHTLVEHSDGDLRRLERDPESEHRR